LYAVQVRTKKARKELNRGNKVRLVFTFKGREEESLIELAEQICEEIFENVQSLATWESAPRLNGKNLVAILAPKP
jgi:translation initiation factor IF-3